MLADTKGSYHELREFLMTIGDIAQILDKWFPPALAEKWDNTGLLLGDPADSVSRIMTCLTVTAESAAEAIEQSAELIVSHHPILFRPVQRLTAIGPERVVYQLARAGVSVYSPHTAYDSAAGGINEQIAGRLELTDVRPLRPVALGETDPAGNVGAGRYGGLGPPQSLANLARSVQAALGAVRVDVVGDGARICRSVAIGCGAGAEFIADAARLGCDAFLTGEARFHQLLEAQNAGIGLVLAGHYATERFAVESLAGRLQRQFPSLAIHASRAEADPLQSTQ